VTAIAEEKKPRRPEIIAIGSGKGGTGKTLLTASLAYALVRVGHRVLVVDADLGTDGLSLFILGPDGRSDVRTFEDSQVLSALLQQPELIENARGRVINRTVGDKHQGVTYEAIVTSRSIYADGTGEDPREELVNLGRPAFQERLGRLFDKLRTEPYDFVLVDTRGGFSFPTADACALADSFIVVMEADYTSFYQQRSLISAIDESAKQLKTSPLLRSILLNKCVDGDEPLFRSKVAETLRLSTGEIYTLPLDPDAARAYREQDLPFLTHPGSAYSFAALRAFSGTLKIVTAEWPETKVAAWNHFVTEISGARKRLELKSSARRGLGRLTTIGLGVALLLLASQFWQARSATAAGRVIEAQNQEAAELRKKLKQASDTLDQQTRTLLDNQRRLGQLQEQERSFSKDVSSANGELASLKAMAVSSALPPPAVERVKLLEQILASSTDKLRKVQQAQDSLVDENARLTGQNRDLDSKARALADALTTQQQQVSSLEAATAAQRLQIEQHAAANRQLAAQVTKDADQRAELVRTESALRSALEECQSRLQTADQLRPQSKP
jgi:flagellar biosynthesis protein FlhG